MPVDAAAPWSRCARALACALVGCALLGCATTWEQVASDPVDLEALSVALQSAEARDDDILIEEDRRLAGAPQDAALSLLDSRADKFGNTDLASLARKELKAFLARDHDNDAIPEGVWLASDEAWDEPWEEAFEEALPSTLEERDAMLASKASGETSVQPGSVEPAMPPPVVPTASRVRDLPPPPKATRAPAVESLSDLDKVRTHYLRNTTNIVARTITLTVPPTYAHRVRWTRGTPQDLADGGQRAEGGAEVRLTNLTLKGAKITVRVRGDANAAIRITAREDVAFACRIQDRLVREAGLRTLLITNDRMVPLR